MNEVIILNIIEQWATSNKCYQTTKALSPKGIMLHSIGVGQPSAERMATAYNAYKPNGSSVCVHAFLEPGTVVQIMPWDKQSWHSGGYANQTHIGIEMCEPSAIRYTGGATFNCIDTAAAREYAKGCYDTAVELFAQLCKTYGIDPMLGIISHAEGWQKGIASNHADPEHLWRGLGLEYTMDTFRTAVKEKMEDTEMARYKTIDDVPQGVYRETVKVLMEQGVISGKADGTIDLSEDMVRNLIYQQRMLNKLTDTVATTVIDKIISAFKET